VRYILSFGAFAILASAVLMTPSNAQQEAADRQRMVEEIDAMLASAPRVPAVSLGSVHVCAPQ